MDKAKLSKTHKNIYEKINIDIEYTRINEVIDTLIKIRDSVPAEAIHVSVVMDVSSSYGYYDSVEIEHSVKVDYWLALTPEELEAKKADSAARSKAAREGKKAAKLKKEEADRKEYERLKGKFEKTT